MMWIFSLFSTTMFKDLKHLLKLPLRLNEMSKSAFILTSRKFNILISSYR